MAGTGQSTSARTSAGTELFATWKIQDLVDGGDDISTSTSSDRKVGASLIIKRPAQFLKIASQTTTTARDYPYDGTSNVTVAGSTTTVVNLATTAAPVVGEYLLITSGTLIGELRRVVSISGTNVTVNRAYGSAPATGVSYLQLVPAFLRTRLLIKGELSTNGATDTPTILVKHFGYSIDLAGTPAFYDPECFIEGPITLANLQLQGNTKETNYYHLGAHARDVEGSIGFKVRLTNLPAGTLSLWACAV